MTSALSIFSKLGYASMMLLRFSARPIQIKIRKRISKDRLKSDAISEVRDRGVLILLYVVVYRKGMRVNPYPGLWRRVVSRDHLGQGAQSVEFDSQDSFYGCS